MVAFIAEKTPADPAWLTLDQVFRNRSELDDWSAVCEVIRSVARYSFETGGILSTGDASGALPALSGRPLHQPASYDLGGRSGSSTVVGLSTAPSSSPARGSR
jgi:hypothetical protein